MSTATDTRFLPVLERVRNLMARAEHPETPAPEAEIALREANKLMTRHAIDEAVLFASQSEAERRKPVVEVWHWMESYSEHSAYLRTMLSAIASANRCRVVISWREPYECTVVGMAEDAHWVQTLYTNCYLAFLSRLNPKFDVSDLDASIYAHKVAGYNWIETWWIMVDALGLRGEVNTRYGKPHTSEACLNHYKSVGIPLRPPIEGKTSSFVAAYRRHAAKIGDTELISTQHTAAYRRSFAKGFADQIARRLWIMEHDAKEEVATAGAELVLVGIEEAVADAFYEQFPEHHPDEQKRRDLLNYEASLEAQRLEAEAEDLKLAAMTPSARRKYLEAKERKERRDRESAERYWAKRDGRITYIGSAARAGASAADQVALSRSTKIDDHGATAGITS